MTYGSIRDEDEQIIIVENRTYNSFIYYFIIEIFLTAFIFIALWCTFSYYYCIRHKYEYDYCWFPYNIHSNITNITNI